MTQMYGCPDCRRTTACTDDQIGRCCWADCRTVAIKLLTAERDLYKELLKEALDRLEHEGGYEFYKSLKERAGL